MLFEWFLINAVNLCLLFLYLYIKANLQKKKKIERERRKKAKKYNCTKRLKQIRCQKTEWVLDIDKDQVTVKSWGTPWGPDSIFLQATLQRDVPSHLPLHGPQGATASSVQVHLNHISPAHVSEPTHKEPRSRIQWAGVAPVGVQESWVGGWRGLELTWGRTGVRGRGQGERKSASCTERPLEITKSDLDVYLETSLSVFHCFCDKVPQIQWLKIAHIGTFLMA